MIARVRGNFFYHVFCLHFNLNLNLFFGGVHYEAIDC
jgi:hypothetical protein